MEDNNKNHPHDTRGGRDRPIRGQNLTSGSACRSAIGTGWGLEPQKTLWIYEAILRPKLTYAATIWWKVTTEKKTSKAILDHIQAVVPRGSFVLKRSTLIAAVRMMLGLKGLDLDIREQAARTAYRLIGESSLAETLKQGYQTGRSGRIARHWDTEKFGSQMDPKQSKEQDAGYKVLTTRRGCPAEMAAIGKCAEKLIEDSVEGRDLQICTDSQASIMALEKPITTSKLVQRVKDTLNELGTRNRVTITWIPGHSGYKGNEKADKHVKQGADMEEQPDGEVGIQYQ
ncbi:uncharacterized protein LOC112906823 [Agrilus planipennis]|uniref:Uncharacterized protein LOC112906823 n=1 Tax=Agrilus planipennis TaxID=224129 RepID=A0A7F5RNJ1_AGRPL|nr:uncharacterized protein LOC112906823 [Agrilus planipennis]